MGYVEGLASGRAIARRVRTDMAYIYLCGFDAPDFRTINRFYKNYPEFIAKALLEFVKYAKETGLIKLNGLALDSTSIEANASSYNVADENQMQVILNTIYEIIKNNEEDEIFGEDNGGNSIKCDLGSDEFKEKYKKAVKFPEKHLDGDKLKYPAKKQIKNALRNPQKTLEKMENAYEHLQNSSQNTVNLTDSECVWRLNKKKNMTMGYQIHNITDLETGLILATMISTNPSDHHEFVKQFEHYEELYGKIPEGTTLVADNGYYTEENLKAIKKHGWDAYIPNKELATLFKHHKEDLSPYSKYNFTFSKDFSYCTCPNNQKLTKHKTQQTSHGTKTFYYVESYKTCKNCPNYKECYKSSTQKIITHYGGDLAKDMHLKMQSEDGKEIYAKRMPSVEPTFGHMKHNQKITQLRAHGIQQGQTQAELIAIGQIVTRINNHIHKNN